MTREEAIKWLELIYSEKTIGVCEECWFHVRWNRFEDLQCGLNDGKIIAMNTYEYEGQTVIPDWCPLREAVDMAIKALDAQPEWISCSDGLPDINQIVVVANKDKKTWDFGQFRGVDFIDQNGRYNWHWKKNTCRIVDYWMPKENAIRMPWKE